MPKKYFIFFFLCVALVNLCVAQKGSHRGGFFKSIFGVGKQKEIRTFNKSLRSNKGANTFSKKQRRVVAGYTSKESDLRSFFRNTKSFRSTSVFNSKKRRVTARGFSRPEKDCSGFSGKIKAFGSTGKYNPKHRKVEQSSGFLAFKLSGKGEFKDSYSGKEHGGSSYAFDSKHKKVSKKKFLFIFNNNRKEGNGNSFENGRIKEHPSYYKYNKNKKSVRHRKGIFRRDKEKKVKRKTGPQMDLFPNGMYHGEKI